ncbi:MAG: type II secretion system F family protein [Pirellulales bacterium]
MSDRFPTFRRIAAWQLPRFSVWPLWTTAAQRKALLRVIAVSLEEGLPLCPLIKAWAADERGIQRRRLNRLARLLEGGMSLPSAVEAVPGLLADEDLLAIRFDAQSGTRTAAVRDRIEARKRASGGAGRRVRNTLIYFCAVLVIGIGCISFSMIWIMPQLVDIFEDFDVDLPQIVRHTVGIAQFSVKYWWIGALAAFALLWAFFSARPGRFLRRSMPARLFYPLRDERSADVLQKLAITTRAGRPIPGAISTLARYHFDPVLRHKLLYVRNEVEQGADVWQSMRAIGLLRPSEERLLETAERIGNRPWVLSQLAAVKGRRTARRLERLSQLLLPALALVFGGFVLVQALTLFLPLVQLIDSLM